MDLADRNFVLMLSLNQNPPTLMSYIAVLTVLMAISYLLSFLIYWLSIMHRMVMLSPSLPKLLSNLLIVLLSPKMERPLQLPRNNLSHIFSNDRTCVIWKFNV